MKMVRCPWYLSPLHRLLTHFTIRHTTDLVHALSEAIHHVSAGLHDPLLSHTLVKDFYSWSQVAERTEVVYNEVVAKSPRDFWERVRRPVSSAPFLITTQ